jgi:hypothetical protein
MGQIAFTRKKLSASPDERSAKKRPQQDAAGVSKICLFRDEIY